LEPRNAAGGVWFLPPSSDKQEVRQPTRQPQEPEIMLLLEVRETNGDAR